MKWKGKVEEEDDGVVVFQYCTVKHKIRMQKYGIRNPNWNLGNILVFPLNLWKGIYYSGIMVGRCSCDEHMIQLFIHTKPLEQKL